MERVITGYWDGEPISRPITAAERLSAELPDEEGFVEVDIDKVHEIIDNTL